MDRREKAPQTQLIRRETQPTPAKIAPSLGSVAPVLIKRAGAKATKRFYEFFTANIRNRNTREAYYRALTDFFAWCDQKNLSIDDLEPIVIAAYVEHLGTVYTKPTVKQHLAAIRMCLDWLVVGQVIPMNPSSSVRGPKYVVKKGKTPVLTADEARQLLDSIDTSTAIGLRDRALIAVSQLQPINAGGPFHHLLKNHKAASLTENWRQKDLKDREAVKDIREGRASQALKSYQERGRVSGLRDQSLYGKYGTDELMGQIGTRFIGRLECVATAEFISQLIGEQEYVAESTSYTSAKESSTTRSYSVQVRKAVLPGTLLDLKPCSQKNGLTGFCITRSLGTFRTHIDGDQLFDVDLGAINESVPAFDPRPPIQQILQPWTEDEARKFGVDLNFKIPKKTPTTKPEVSPKKRRSKTKNNPIADPLEGLFE